MLKVCLTPVLMMGVLSGIETSWHSHAHNPQGEALEIHTCLSGPSFVGTLAPSSGLYGAGLEWGFPVVIGPLMVGVAPQVGLSHDSRGYQELPMRTQFEVGGWVYASYDRIVVGVKYWHLSNASLHHTSRQPNTGLDIVAVMSGITF
jgi:hypothetical protein